MDRSRETEPGGWRSNLAAAGIVILAAALRFYGLRWGLPNSLHAYSYHPDEFLTVGAAFGAVYVAHSFDPRFYNYPSLYIYLSALAIGVALGYGVHPTLSNIYLAARVVTALTGTAAVWVTYWAGKTLFGRTAGLLAALVLAIAPLHVQHSHFATVDVPSTLFVAAALGFAGLIMKRGSWRDYLVGGAMAGLAAGTKYNAGLVLLALVAAHFLREKTEDDPKRGSRPAAMIGCALAAFVISTPGSVLRTHEFLAGLAHELHHARAGHGLEFAGTANGFIYTFTSSLWYGLGPALAILFVVAAVWGVTRRDRRSLVILAFVMPYYALISLSQVRFARYALPLFAAAAMLTGGLMADWYVLTMRRWLSPVRLTWAAVCSVALLATLCYTNELNGAFGRPEPRDAAAKWIHAHVPKGSRIGVFEVPWFYSPPLSKKLGFGTMRTRREAMKSSPFQLVVFADCRRPGCWWTDRAPPDYVVASNYELGPGQRLWTNRPISHRDRRWVDRILADERIVRRYYGRIAGFGYDTRYRSWRFGLPPDMGYPFAGLVIYQRASSPPVHGVTQHSTLNSQPSHD